MRIEENVPLAPLTTLGVGGRARWLARVTTEAEVVEAVDWAATREVPIQVLGGGSNVLVSDHGFEGLVLHMAMAGVAGHDDQAERVYRVAAGELWDGLVERVVAEGCAGIECLAGIPGTVGGTPVQNVGAYGQEVASTIDCVRAYDRMARRFVEFAVAECGFGYRRSRFNTIDRGRYIVTRVDFRLALGAQVGGQPRILYADLRRMFAEGQEPSLAEIAAAVRRIRRAKGMLLVPGDADCRSAGSFFKNPLIPKEQYAALASCGQTEPPKYPAEPGWVKVPAAWLIEQAGFPKGYRFAGAQGRVGISSRHTLALINLGQAQAADLLALRDEIVARVEARFAIRLEMEPVLVGFL